MAAARFPVYPGIQGHRVPGVSDFEQGFSYQFKNKNA